MTEKVPAHNPTESMDLKMDFEDLVSKADNLTSDIIRMRLSGWTTDHIADQFRLGRGRVEKIIRCALSELSRECLPKRTVGIKPSSL